AFFVVDRVFKQSLTEPLRGAALYLSQRQERIDDSAEVVNDDVARNLWHPGVLIHLDLADVTAVRVSQGLGLIISATLERSLRAGHPTFSYCLGQTRETEAAIGPDDRKASVDELDVVGGS